MQDNNCVSCCSSDCEVHELSVWKKYILFSKYLSFCVFDKSTNFKIYDVIIDIIVH